MRRTTRVRDTRMRTARVHRLFWQAARATERSRRRLARPAAPAASPVRPAFAVHALRPDAPPLTVALTVDDGPDPRWTPRILELLAETQVTATFFLVGRNVRRWPRLAARVAAAGHAIGNHTLRHPEPFAALIDTRLREEIEVAQRLIEDATGVSPRLFRAPAGGWSPRVFRATADAGLVGVDWSIDTRDWARPGTFPVASRLRRCRGGDIVLCHDSGHDRTQTVAALAAVLPELRRRGLRFAALDAGNTREDDFEKEQQ